MLRLGEILIWKAVTLISPQLSFTGKAEGWVQEGQVSGNPEYVLCMN